MLVFSLFLNVYAHAQTAVVESNIAQEPGPSAKKVLPDFNFLLNTIPLSIGTLGLGGAVEYQPLQTLSLWLGLERQGVGNSLSFDNELYKVVNTDEAAGLRYYPLAERLLNFFIDAGYKWSRVETDYTPGLLQGVLASQSDYISGPFAGAGLRFRWNRRGRFTMMADLEVGYEPGKLQSATYVGDSPGLIGPTRAHLDTTVGYGFFPKGRFGCNF